MGNSAHIPTTTHNPNPAPWIEEAQSCTNPATTDQEKNTLISARRFLKEQWEEEHRNLEPTCKFENCHEFLVATKTPRSSRV
jgi:hypothetical protein